MEIENERPWVFSLGQSQAAFQRGEIASRRAATRSPGTFCSNGKNLIHEKINVTISPEKKGEYISFLPVQKGKRGFRYEFIFFLGCLKPQARLPSEFQSISAEGKGI